MLFSSWIFIAFFLPVTWLGYFFLMRRADREIAMLWLVAASLFFYGWFKLVYLLIVLISMAANYALGMMLAQKPWSQKKRRNLLIFGIIGNLAALFYYKYTGLFFKSLNAAGGHWDIPDIILPLGISFFTFQKIAWLVDSYRRETQEPNFLHYALFITFFPQLIAGPIVHHKQVIPQFMKKEAAKINWDMVATGMTVFILGLFKKVGIADHMGDIADPIFDQAAMGNVITFFEAWLGAGAYTLQIYFDFSGYSDMAVGLAALFGIHLPLNFFSPYKARNIIDFWRRWHITLSKFLRDYLYIPLGGNRKGAFRRYANLLLTMLLGGLWHGANWTFAVWGGLHGLYLCINHAWQKTGINMPRALAQTLTLLSVIVAWVFFRADSMETATAMLKGMANMNGMALRDEAAFLAKALNAIGLHVEPSVSKMLQISEKWYLLWIATAIALFAPTVHEFTGKRLALDETKVAAEAKPPRLQWAQTPLWACLIALLGCVSLLFLTRVNAFIYFQF